MKKYRAQQIITDEPVAKPRTLDVHNLKQGDGFVKRSKFLRNCSAVISTDKPITSWEMVTSELNQVLNIRGTFSLLALTMQNALLEFASSSDRDELINEEEVYLSFCTVTSKRWSPRSGTINPVVSKYKIDGF